MLGRTIGARALADTGRRELPTEQAGARPGGVRANQTMTEATDVRVATARKP